MTEATAEELAGSQRRLVQATARLLRQAGFISSPSGNHINAWGIARVALWRIREWRGGPGTSALDATRPASVEVVDWYRSPEVRDATLRALQDEYPDRLCALVRVCR